MMRMSFLTRYIAVLIGVLLSCSGPAPEVTPDTTSAPGGNPSSGTFHLRCHEGNASDCTVQGERYEKGQGVDKDTAKAASLYQKACDTGDVQGCYRLGFLYEAGAGGVSQDTIETEEEIYR